MSTGGPGLVFEKILRVPHLSPHDRWDFGKIVGNVDLVGPRSTSK